MKVERIGPLALVALLFFTACGDELEPTPSVQATAEPVAPPVASVPTDCDAYPYGNACSYTNGRAHCHTETVTHPNRNGYTTDLPLYKGSSRRW